jgi:hypothetical protein
MYSEEFKIVADTLKLRPRWSITDNNIVFEWDCKTDCSVKNLAINNCSRI